MRPLNLREFAEELRRGGDIRQGDLADEILQLIDIEAEVAEPYSDLCADLDHYAPESLAEKPEKQMEWLGDRSNLLGEIEEALDAAGIDAKAPNGTPLDTLDRIKQLIEERPAPMEYDL